jgi:hypothetical protein
MNWCKQAKFIIKEKEYFSFCVLNNPFVFGFAMYCWFSEIRIEFNFS